MQSIVMMAAQLERLGAALDLAIVAGLVVFIAGVVLMRLAVRP